MTIEQLRYFITIVDMGSYMEAALELNISQSSVSKQIQSLENELGIHLFDRKFRKAKLTAEGKKLLPEVRAVLEKTDHLLSFASDLRSGHAKHFKVVTLPFLGYLGLYAPLGRFEIEHPDCLLEVTELEEPQLMRRLLSHDFDMAITYEYEYDLSNLKQDFFSITSDEIVVAIHKDHPLSMQESITLDDLAGVSLLLMEPYTCISKLCIKYFNEQGFLPNITFRGRPETIFGGAEAQRGAALLTRKQAQCYATNDAVTVSFDPPLFIAIGAVPGKNQQNKEEIEHLVELLTSIKSNCTNKAE